MSEFKLMCAALDAAERACAPREPYSDPERSECICCQRVFPNHTMEVIADNYLCAECGQDGDDLYALAQRLGQEVDRLREDRRNMRVAITQFLGLIEDVTTFDEEERRQKVAALCGLRNAAHLYLSPKGGL